MKEKPQWLPVLKCVGELTNVAAMRQLQICYTRDAYLLKV